MERSTLSSAKDRVRSTTANGLSTAVSAAKDRLPDRLTKRKREQEMARKRGFILGGLLALGAALGAVGALVARRRQQHTWEEYEPETAPPSDGAVTEPAPTLNSRQ